MLKMVLPTTTLRQGDNLVFKLLSAWGLRVNSQKQRNLDGRRRTVDVRKVKAHRLTVGFYLPTLRIANRQGQRGHEIEIYISQ